MMKFRVELRPPVDPKQYEDCYGKISPLIELTNRFSLSSHQVGTVAGIDRSYSFAKFLLGRHPDLDLLFHLTCRDLNKANIASRLDMLRGVNVQHILIVSGQDYEHSGDELSFQDSRAVLEHIEGSDLKRNFESIGIGAYLTSSCYRGQELQALRAKVRIECVNAIHTQCVLTRADAVAMHRCLLAHSEHKGNRSLTHHFGLPLFVDRLTLGRCCRLIGAAVPADLAEIQFTRQKSRSYLTGMCNDIAELCVSSGADTSIDIYPFGLYDFAYDLIKDLTSAAPVE